MTNYEWLLNMGGEERQAWFDAEHVDVNDALAHKNDVRADDVDANDVDVSQDSREKLEAELRDELRLVFGGNGGQRYASYKFVQSLLDRQAAIIEREAFMRGRASLDDEFAEYADEIAELASERDALTAECDALADDLRDCNRERESLRRALGVAIDHAHDILQLIDEGMA